MNDLPAHYRDETLIDEAWLREHCDQCPYEHHYYFGTACVEACAFHWNITTGHKDINGGLSFLKSHLTLGSLLLLLAALGWTAPQTGGTK